LQITLSLGTMSNYMLAFTINPDCEDGRTLLQIKDLLGNYDGQVLFHSFNTKAAMKSFIAEYYEGFNSFTMYKKQDINLK